MWPVETIPSFWLLPPDLPVGAEPGETPPGAVPAALLLHLPPGHRAPQPQDPPGLRRQADQGHARAARNLLRLLLPRPRQRSQPGWHPGTLHQAQVQEAEIICKFLHNFINLEFWKLFSP